MPNLLAQALGRIAARQELVSKIVLPSSMPRSFLHEISNEAQSDSCWSYVVAKEPEAGEIAAGSAIRYRSPTDQAVRSVVLVATVGDMKDLKSLETNADLLSGGLPGGVRRNDDAYIRIDAIAAEIADILGKDGDFSSALIGSLPAALRSVFSFLGDAYQEVGNSGIEWIDAYWQHLASMTAALPNLLSEAAASTPFAEQAAFTAAGLPFPNSSAGYEARHTPKRFAQLVQLKWSNRSSAIRTADEIGLKSGNQRHPIKAIEWEEYSLSLGRFLHPILALSQHSIGNVSKPSGTWRTAWRAVTEELFFGNVEIGEVEVQCEIETSEGEWEPVPEFPSMEASLVLPAAVNKVEDKLLKVASVRLRVRGSQEEQLSQNPEVTVSITPKSAFKIEAVTSEMVAGELHVTFQLLKPVSSKCRWPEKIVRLSINTENAAAEMYIGGKSVALKLLVPNPARPSCFVFDDASKKLTKIYNHSDTYLQLDRDASLLFSEVVDDDLEINLPASVKRPVLASFNAEGNVQWSGGRKPLLVESDHGVPGMQLHQLNPIPDDNLLDIGGLPVLVSKDEVEAGQLSPIHAAFSGEQICAPNDDELRVLKQDPRWDLETWISNECIQSPPSNHFKRTLGSCVLSIGGRGGIEGIIWDDTLKMHLDSGELADLVTPFSGLNDNSLDSFWNAFAGLRLDLCQQTFPDGSKPGFLDLSFVPEAAIKKYLSVFGEFLASTKAGKVEQQRYWQVYPFSALLVDAHYGRIVGSLLSPLHPVRLAWAWSAQAAAAEVRSDAAFQKASAIFMRFIDGESFPLAGPNLQNSLESLQFVNTSLGPKEFFAGWGLLGSKELDRRLRSEGVTLFDKQLPLGSVSGLSNGGISSSIKDYIRNYPLTPHLRIEVSGEENKERVAATDEALVEAACRILTDDSTSLPGGMTVFESSKRRGKHPNARYVLGRLEAAQQHAGLPPPLPQFEWVVSDQSAAVDLLLLEESPVKIDIAKDDQISAGTTGPSLPISRYQTWPVPEGADPTRSVTWLPSSIGSYGRLPEFRKALDGLEELACGGLPKLQCQINLGENVGVGRAMWAVTGNRHLNPSALTARLETLRNGYMMWEWRPAFMGQDKRVRISNQLSTSHPYTVLARPSAGLQSQLAKLLELIGIKNGAEYLDDITRSLGARGVGLSSLLSMGHKQSLGAIGFYLAFKVLEHWETSAPEGTIRCIIPLDACFPFIDAMAADANELESNQRADLLLLEATFVEGVVPELIFHPIEVKARQNNGSTFPDRSSVEVGDALGQLESTIDVVKRFQKNWVSSNGSQVLVNSAFASLLEACLALKPAGSSKDSNLEINLIEAVANGKGNVRSTAGTLLYFMAQGVAGNGASQEFRSGSTERAGQLMSSMAGAVPIDGNSPIAERVTDLISTSWPKGAQGSSGRDRNRPPTSSGDRVKSTDDLTTNGNSVSPPAQAGFDEVGGTTVTGQSPTSDHLEQRNHEEAATAPVKEERSDATGAEKQGQGAASTQEKLAANEASARQEANSSGAPVNTQQEGISVRVGTAGGSTPVLYQPSDTQLTQLNVGVVGDLGTGKTQFLQSFVYQLVSSQHVNRSVKPKVFIFDFKNDYSTEKFRSAIDAKVLDPTETLPVNFFQLDDTAGEQDKVRRAIFFSSTLDTIVGIGPVQQNRLMNAVLEAYESCALGYYPMLPDVLDIYKAGVDGKPDKVISVLEKLVLFRVFETDPNKVVGFREFFDRSVVLNLTTLAAAGQQLADVVVSIFLDHLYFDHMKRIQKPGFEVGEDGVNRRVVDTLVLIDEAHHAMSQGYEVLMKLMLEGREFGLGVVLSSQYLSHFQLGKQDWAEPLSTWIVHKVRGAKARDFEKIGFPVKSTAGLADRVSQLEPHWAYYRCDHGNREGVLMKGLPFFQLDIE